MKKLVKDLELWEVDYLVAKAEGFEATIVNEECSIPWFDGRHADTQPYAPTTNPSQAWPIIEKGGIATRSDIHMAYKPMKKAHDIECRMYGKTALEAAMRCRVASVYGDEVEI